MQSSFNVIKASNATVDGKKEINTRYVSKVIYSGMENDEEQIFPDGNFQKQGEEILEQYKQLGMQVISGAKEKAEELITKAKEEAQLIEKDAYESGYNQGKNNGYDDGYNAGLIKIKEQCEADVTEKIDKANEILLSCENQYNEYMKEKEKDILDLAFNIAKAITKTEFEKSESILKLVEPLLEENKGEENIIIRCNETYKEILEEKKKNLSEIYNLKGSLFILEDPLMEIGNVIVETSKGKVVTGLDVALERIELLFKEQAGGSND